MNNRFLISLLFLLFVQISFAQTIFTVESIPNPKARGNSNWISDPDNFISAADEAEINAMINDLEANSTAQIAVVLVNSIGDRNPKDFATKLFRHWGIGQADKNNGLLIISVMNQRRTEFETGYGMEGVLPDIYCYRIGMQELVPHFREGDYGRGLINTVSRIKETLEDPAALEEIRSERRSNEFPAEKVLNIYLLANLFFHLILIIRLIFILRSKEDLYDKYMDVRRWHGWGWMLLFPLPYVLFYFYEKWLLKHLRQHPRHSKINGEPMRLLSEEEEDDFLEKGQITEEEIGSVDYDVWINDETDVLILRYAKRFSKYSACEMCNYQTYYLAHTYTVQAATYNSSGLKRHVHECKNCDWKVMKDIKIPRKQRSSSGGGFGGGGGGSSFGGGSSGGGGGGVSW